MASSYFIIQDRTNADRKFKNLQHQLWDHFLEYLRSGSPSLALSTFLKNNNVELPSGIRFATNSQLVAIPTPIGLKLYVPGKGDFYFREELVDGKRPTFQSSSQPPKFGTADVSGHHNGKSSFVHSWDSIFLAIQAICVQVIKDVRYFEDVQLAAPEYQNFRLDFASCEIQWLLSCARFYLGCCANFNCFDGLSVPMYQYAMVEMTVMGLCLYQGKNQASPTQVTDWLKSCPDPFEITKPTIGDCGGMTAFVSIFGLKIETRNRCGLRVPGERRSKFVRSGFAGLQVGFSSPASHNETAPVVNTSSPVSRIMPTPTTYVTGSGALIADNIDVDLDA